MRADQLLSAADTVVVLLRKSDLLTSIRQHRDAKTEAAVQASHSRLTQSARILLNGANGFSLAEKELCSKLHLSSLISVDYWQALLNKNGDAKAQRAELVQLYSRAMFASSHLPGLVGLLSSTESAPAAITTSPGENTVVIILTDAGEKASDPDRISRAIDGIDMIYSGSVSLSLRPAIDLQLREISGHPDKRLVFLGDRDGVAALHTVLESIPIALSEYGEDDDIDLERFVRSLPIFHDLAALAEHGKFTHAQLRDIDDTLHQGIMLVLESGVVVDQAPPPNDPDRDVTTLNKRVDEYQSNHSDQLHARETAASPTSGFAREAKNNYGYLDRANGQGAGNHAEVDQVSDEYYQQYLQERERLRSQPAYRNNGGSDSADRSGQRVEGSDSDLGDKQSPMSSLLRGLSRSKER